jgi:hypothetical protein
MWEFGVDVSGLEYGLFLDSSEYLLLKVDFISWNELFNKISRFEERTFIKKITAFYVTPCGLVDRY